MIIKKTYHDVSHLPTTLHANVSVPSAASTTLHRRHLQHDLLLLFFALSLSAACRVLLPHSLLSRSKCVWGDDYSSSYFVILLGDHPISLRHVAALKSGRSPSMPPTSLPSASLLLRFLFLVIAYCHCVGCPGEAVSVAFHHHLPVNPPVHLLVRPPVHPPQAPLLTQRG